MGHTNSLNTSSHWSIEEIDYLKKYFNYLSFEEISNNLYNYFYVIRSISSIKVKATRLKLKRK